MNITIDPLYFLIGGSIVAVGLVIGWVWFWWVFKTKNESVKEFVTDVSFLQIMTVVLVVVATAFLTLAGTIKGELAGAIYSGIVGYVLGSIKSKQL
jgi:Ca2+/Na+ antiporter